MTSGSKGPIDRLHDQVIREAETLMTDSQLRGIGIAVFAAACEAAALIVRATATSTQLATIDECLKVSINLTDRFKQIIQDEHRKEGAKIVNRILSLPKEQWDPNAWKP